MAPPPLPPARPLLTAAAAAATASRTEEEAMGSQDLAQEEVAETVSAEPSAPTTPAPRVGEVATDEHGFGLAFDGAGADYDGGGVLE